MIGFRLTIGTHLEKKVHKEAVDFFISNFLYF